MNRGLYGPFSGRQPTGAVGISPIYESPDSGIYAVSSNINWSHGLNYRPKLWTVGLRVLNAFGSYQVGMEIGFLQFQVDSGGVLANAGNMTPYVTTALIGFYTGDVLPKISDPSSAFTNIPIVAANLRPFARIFG